MLVSELVAMPIFLLCCMALVVAAKFQARSADQRAAAWKRGYDEMKAAFESMSAANATNAATLREALDMLKQRAA